MKEYYSSGEHNRFEEHRVFKAELYKTKDFRETGAEQSSQGHEFKPDVKKSRKKSVSNNPIKKAIEKMTSSAASVATTVVSTVVMAVAAVVVCLNLFSPVPSLEIEELNVGNDYVEYDVEIGELEENTEYSLVIENNFHTFEYDVEEAGGYQGIVTGLKPGLPYSLFLLGRTENGESTYHETQFFTTNTDTPSAVFDIKLKKGKDGTADIEYSVYVSDTNRRGSGYYLEMSSSGQTYYLDDSMEGGFFKGAALSAPHGEITVIVKGIIDGKIASIAERHITNLITDPPIEEPSIEEPPIEEPPIEKLYIEVSDLESVGINCYNIHYVFNKINIKGVATMELYYDGEEEPSEQRELYCGALGAWSTEYVELPIGCTSLKIKASVKEIDEKGDPVDVFSTEKSFEFSEQLTVVPWVDTVNGATYLDLYGNLTQEATVVVTDNQSGEATEFLLYDERYSSFNSVLSWENSQGVVNYSYKVINSAGEEIVRGGEFTVDYSFESSEFSINYRNPGDAVVTYNGDGTMNVYIFAEYTSTDPDVYCELVLDKAYRLSGYVFVMENVRVGSYGLEYKICKDLDGVKYVMNRVYPSGTVGMNPYVDGYAEFDGAQVTVVISPSSQCDFSNMCFVSSDGEEITVGAESVTVDHETGEYIIELTFENEVECVIAYLSAKPIAPSLDYDAITAVMELKGSEYCPCILEFIK